jgi:hypothetical protein
MIEANFCQKTAGIDAGFMVCWVQATGLTMGGLATRKGNAPMTEQFVFLGFRWVPCGLPPAGWGHSPQTDQVTAPCNVSGCVTRRDWSADLNLNRALYFNTAAEALAEGLDASHDNPDHYKLCAYRALPLVFDQNDNVQTIPLDALFVPSLSTLPLPPEPDLTGFVCLGYDVVEYTMREPGICHNFACSPLFCNYMAHLFWVNQYCLLPDLATAHQVAQIFAKGPVEPGPYMIVEVLAKENEP